MGFELIILVVISTDCTSSCKSSYHMITTMMTPGSKYVPTFLAHLAFRPYELLLSLIVHPSTFHILIFSSETTGPIATKHWWNGPWVASSQNCVRWSRLPTKMAVKLKIQKRGDEFKEKFYWANLNQTLLKWSLGGPLPTLCPAFQTSNYAT